MKETKELLQTGSGNLNNHRIEYLDFARGMAIFFMILVHVLETYGSMAVYNSLFGQIIDFLGSPPAAPVFMFIMGIFLIYPRDRGVKEGIKRGIVLMLLGYLLSFIRYNLPEMWGVTSYPYEFDVFSFVWEVDILPFAGFAMIVLAIIRKALPWPVIWVLMAVAITTVAPLLWGIDSEVPIVEWFFGLLWGDYVDVFFPLFPWLTFPLLGMVYGYILKEKGFNTKIRCSFTITGVVLLVVGTVITLTDMDFHLGDYYRSGPGGMIWICGFVLVWLFLCELFVTKFPKNWLSNLFSYWSRNITTLYFIHWMIMGWGPALFPYKQQSLLTTILLMIIIVPTSHWCTQAWLKSISFAKKKLI